MIIGSSASILPFKSINAIIYHRILKFYTKFAELNNIKI